MLDRNLQSRSFQSLHALHELLVLIIRIAFIFHIRRGKMGESAHHFNPLHGFHFFRKRSRFVNLYANPVHACVQGDMDFGFFTAPQPGFIQQGQAFFIKDGMGDVKPHAKVCHRRTDRHSPQYEDRFGDARFPQLHRFLYQRHRKIIHAGLYAGDGHRNRAVAVGVGFYHRAEFCAHVQISLGHFNIIHDSIQIHYCPCSPVRLHEFLLLN